MILVINGSPNKNSKTLSVTSEILKHSNEEIEYINAYKITADSCDDCKYCHTKKGCVKRDDMDIIYKLLYKANTLVISSPVYFGGMTDQTMKIINRFQRFFEQKYSLKDSNIPRLNNLFVVSTQGGINPDMFNGVFQTFKILELLFNPDYSAIVTVPSTDDFHPLDQTKVLKKIQKIKKKMITFK
jgi:multimeric flavodoxin WrbA